jgi:hypothetical protein
MEHASIAVKSDSKIIILWHLTKSVKSWRTLAYQEVILRIGLLAKLIEEMYSKKFCW